MYGYPYGDDLTEDFGTDLNADGNLDDEAFAENVIAEEDRQAGPEQPASVSLAAQHLQEEIDSLGLLVDVEDLFPAEVVSCPPGKHEWCESDGPDFTCVRCGFVFTYEPDEVAS